ncbi:hypothetical protein EB796_008096 [Bugula neritina]|uniref:Uncharacterized protein n=1 Tax=Bugula neritina TaxID=10212 RepID=A0A7J7K5R9_BUGNE|nr:hypothetical protein EB796_008096 [Bugula neritina]
MTHQKWAVVNQKMMSIMPRIITKQETTPKKKVETTTPPVETDATSVTAGLDSSVLEEIRLLLANQKKALADVQSQVAIMSSRLDEQQISINQQDQLLAEHSNSIGELKGRQDRATSDIYTLQSAIVSHSRDKDQHLPSTTEYEATTTPTTSTTTTTTAASWSTSAVGVEAAGPVQSLTSELHKVEGRVTELEELHTTLSSVLQHVILEKVWLNATSAPQQKSSSEPGLDLQDIKENVTYFSEADVQEVEERTNQVISSIEKWNKVEQTLHASLSNLHATHRSYSQELSQLTNYTLNNGVIIGQLGEARLRDGVSILSLINSTSWLGQRLSQLKSAMNVNQNTTEETNRQIEAQISQLLELIQLNSLKVIAMQDALKGQGSLFESQLNHTIQELHSLERSLSSIDLSVNSSLTHLTGRVQINKERSDMLWSRLRIIDNRLAHVEVKYLTQEVNKYQKSNDDLKQSIKLMEMEDQLEVIESNINTQQSNHEALNSRLNSVADLVNSLTSSMSTVQDKWRV